MAAHQLNQSQRAEKSSKSGFHSVYFDDCDCRLPSLQSKRDRQFSWSARSAREERFCVGDLRRALTARISAHVVIDPPGNDGVERKIFRVLGETITP